MTHLKVAVRVRPLSQRETDSISVIDVENGCTIAITNVKVPEQNAGDSRERTRRFTFDYAFEETSTQDQVFEAIENVIGKAIKNRYHSCVLAYGQSSSGKTHTMMGFPHDPGLTPKLCEKLFDYLEETAVGNEVSEMKISVSYLEIYNEKVRDLLCRDVEKKVHKPLKVREHPKKGPYVQGLTEHPVGSSNDLIGCLEIGNNRRRVAATFNNPRSSRSHSVFSVCYGGVKLHLVDLAGSERAEHGCYGTCRFREGANINKSLVALGNVISALAEQTTTNNKQRLQHQSPSRLNLKRRFVPYRDSVLTWLLKDTLAGNSNTVMIATVSPSSSCYSESVNTLRFGQRAKLIRSQPVLHVEDPNEATIRELRAEIARLRELLKLQSQLTPVNLKDSMFEAPTTFSTEVDDKLPRTNNTVYDNDSGLNTGISDTSSCSSVNLETDDSESANHFPELNLSDVNLESSIELTDTLSLENIPKVTSDLKENQCQSETKSEASTKDQITTETLVPLMNVSSTVQNKKQKLHRTFSVDQQITMEKDKPKLFGSHENIRKASVSSLPPLVRRQSLVKNKSPKQSPKRKPPEVNKVDKASTTEKSVKAKVDSIRRLPTKPRAQMIAAVTNRLYSKSKKKEVATDTDDINSYQLPNPRETSICTNARFRLRELTQRALRAHRNKHVEIQTDNLPILRVKETCTDVDDLKVALLEIKDSETCTDQISMVDKSTDCNLMNYQTTGNNGLTITRSCGVQVKEDNEKPGTSSVSFAKYLTNLQEPTYEIISESCPNNPIYTSSVNINISHNYINSNRTGDTISDDSLEDSTQNVNLPTPDLISNHNSLEQNALSGNDVPVNSNDPLNVKYADITALPITADECLKEDFFVYPDVFQATCKVSPPLKEQITNIDIPKICAAEICLLKRLDDYCQPFITDAPTLAKPVVIEPKEASCVECVTVKEPLILKSIMRQINNYPEIQDDITSNNSSIEDSCCEIPDSLEYHMANNKKVHFRKERKQSDNQRMIKAMSSFLEEATTLMSNLAAVAVKTERPVSSIQDEFDLQVTVNDISGLKRFANRPRKVKRQKPSDHAETQTDKILQGHNFTQTYSAQYSDSFTQYGKSIPVNKFEALLEDSCRRLGEKINFIPERMTSSACSLHEEVSDRLSQPFSFNPWDLSSTSNYVEDSSLESNPVTFSDYGSLPRRSYRRHRAPSCSPSAYLKQLTSLRKQVIESSREELVNNSN